MEEFSAWMEFNGSGIDPASHNVNKWRELSEYATGPAYRRIYEELNSYLQKYDYSTDIAVLGQVCARLLERFEDLGVIEHYRFLEERKLEFVDAGLLILTQTMTVH